MKNHIQLALGDRAEAPQTKIVQEENWRGNLQKSERMTDEEPLPPGSKQDHLKEFRTLRGQVPVEALQGG